MSGRIAVLVCGEAQRGDDGAALAAVELLPAEARARAEVVVVGQLGVQDLLDAADAGSGCVVVDAVAGIAPGEIRVHPLADLVALGAARASGTAAGPGAPVPRSSHELPIDQVLALVATLRGAAPAGTFVGIGGIDWGLGAPLSAPVAAALPAFAAAIERAITELLPPERYCG